MEMEKRYKSGLVEKKEIGKNFLKPSLKVKRKAMNGDRKKL